MPLKSWRFQACKMYWDETSSSKDRRAQFLYTHTQIFRSFPFYTAHWRVGKLFCENSLRSCETREVVLLWWGSYSLTVSMSSCMQPFFNFHTFRAYKRLTVPSDTLIHTAFVQFNMEAFCHMRVYKKENSAAHRSRVIGTHPTIFQMIRVGSPYNPGPNLLSGKTIWSTRGHDQQWRSGIPTNVRLLGTWCERGFLGDWKKTMAIIWNTMKRDVPNAPKENS